MVTELATLAGATSVARVVSDFGQIVGRAETGDGGIEHAMERNRAPTGLPHGRRRRWYAARTRSRSEKAAYRVLESNGIESYLPLVEQQRRWADRKKWVEFPLFPGYLFVRSHRDDLGSVLATPGVVDVVRVEGRPAVVREDEIASVRALIEGVRRTGELPRASDYVVVGERVRVTEGPFAGLVGTLVEERGRTRVAVRLRVLRQAVSVDLDRCWLRPVAAKIDH